MSGIIFNIQRFSLFDGPGVRTVVFLKGCPLRCIWCHNPEGFLGERQIMYNADRCIGCGACTAVCERGCHTFKDGAHLFDRNCCTSCGKCAEVCYSLSLTAEGTLMTSHEVMSQVLRDANVYRESGGGMTLSGGEPLMQGAFSTELLKKAKENGLHTCVETSGFGNAEVLTEMASYTDLFLFDYKITGDEAHRKLCGVPQTPILKNLDILENLGASIILRCPLIPDINGTDEHIEGIARTALAHRKSVRDIHIEPYHRLGISKAAQLGMIPMYEADLPDNVSVRRFADKLQQLCGEIIKITVN